MTSALLASIPSPGFKNLEIGPLNLRMYGLMIALGVVAAVWLAQRLWARDGGNPEDISRIALWAVPAGVVGARAYHVITDWKRFQQDGWAEAFKIWEGGLGIPGGMAAGIAVGVWVARRRGLPTGRVIDAVMPGLPLGQAIGRLGNWFNQELFGRPTDLPWGLEIHPEHRPVQYSDQTTFHPTFLYEALWNLALCAVLLALGRRKALPPGSLLAVYAGGYGLGRLWVESLRADAASLLLGVRVNVWMSLVLIAGSAVYLAVALRRQTRAGLKFR